MSDSHFFQGELHVGGHGDDVAPWGGDRRAGAVRASGSLLGAYTTIQTVLNRLADRQLLTRHKVGNAFEYRPAISEADHVSESIAQRLAAASTDARQTALARLIGELTEREVTDLRRKARRASVE